MALIGKPRGDAIVDKTVVCGENKWNVVLEQELHMVMASFHFGAWEFLPQVFARFGFRVNLGVGAQKNRSFDRLVSGLRRNQGVRFLHKVKSIMSGLRKPGVTGFMLDNTSQGRRVWVDVDGCRLGLPGLGFRFGKSVVTAFAFFDKGRLRVRTYPAGDERAAAQALLEQVRARPEEWVFWGKAGAIRSPNAEVRMPS